MAEAPQMDPAEALRKMREMQRKMGKGKRKPTKPAPGANDQELYPAQPAEGFTEFRLARRGRKRGGPTVA